MNKDLTPEVIEKMLAEDVADIPPIVPLVSEESPRRRKGVRIKVTYLVLRGTIQGATAILERIGLFDVIVREIITHGFGIPTNGNVIIPPSAIIRIEVVE